MEQLCEIAEFNLADLHSGQEGKRLSICCFYTACGVKDSNLQGHLRPTALQAACFTDCGLRAPLPGIEPWLLLNDENSPSERGTTHPLRGGGIFVSLGCPQLGQCFFQGFNRAPHFLHFGSGITSCCPGSWGRLSSAWVSTCLPPDCRNSGSRTRKFRVYPIHPPQ